MLNLTPDQRALGRENANTVIGSTRRDFLKAAAVAPAWAPSTSATRGWATSPPVRAPRSSAPATKGCGAMIHDHNRAYVDFVGSATSAPRRQERGVKEFSRPQGLLRRRRPRSSHQYPDVDAMLKDDRVEMVVIALPLWLHAPIAIQAMKAGKHVFCEKLMAHTVGQCKDMVAGRPRHQQAPRRSATSGITRSLYDNANYLVQEGHLGEIRHIRALWHRNNACPDREGLRRQASVRRLQGEPVYKSRTRQGNVVYFDGWKPDIPDRREGRLRQVRLQVARRNWSAGGSTTGPAPA